MTKTSCEDGRRHNGGNSLFDYVNHVTKDVTGSFNTHRFARARAARDVKRTDYIIVNGPR